jgi:threonine dehydratase
MDLTIGDMEEAARSLQGVIHRTPLQSSRTFSALSGASIWLKPECLQKAGSWKIRGAYTALCRLDARDRARGVVTFSSGNWGQGVACAATLLGIAATIVLPERVNPRKLSAIRGYGATVVIHGRDSELMFEKARELETRDGSVLINPLNNRDMMVGAASLGLEIIAERPDIEAIVVPIGGGALIAGVAAGAKQRNPNVRVYGVQPYGACAVRESLRTGTLVDLAKVDTIADGLAVKRPNPETVELIGRLVDEIVLVSDDEIRRGMYLLLERAKLLVEPSGAAGLAAVLNGRIPAVRGRETVVVLTGGNADFGLLRDVLEADAPAVGEVAR